MGSLPNNTLIEPPWGIPKTCFSHAQFIERILLSVKWIVIIPQGHGHYMDTEAEADVQKDLEDLQTICISALSRRAGVPRVCGCILV